MFLNDSLKHRWITVSIPSTFGVDHGDRSVSAQPQAARASTLNGTGVGKAELFEARFEVLPGCEPAFARGAFGHRWVATEKNVALRIPNTNGVGFGECCFGGG